MRRLLSPRELAELLPTPERAPTPEELERLVPSDVASRPLRPDGWGPWAPPPWSPLPSSSKKAS